MIIGVFTINTKTNDKLYRSVMPTSHSNINDCIQEFMCSNKCLSGVIDKENYRYVYLHLGDDVYAVAQITLDEMVYSTQRLLENIKKCNKNDLFNILTCIDNSVEKGVFIEEDEMDKIISMESQDEKVYDIMIKHKEEEQRKRNKEVMKKTKEKDFMNKVVEMDKIIKNEKLKSMMETPAHTEKIESSKEPVLIILSEKIQVSLNQEGSFTENNHTGELSVVITDTEYEDLEIRLDSIKKNYKLSPYLDKEALSHNVLKFTKTRQINKNIPLCKLNQKLSVQPLSFEFWPSEDENRFSNTVTVIANLNLSDITVQFSVMDLLEFEIEDCPCEEKTKLVFLKLGEMKKGDSKSFEIKYQSFDKNAIFPMDVKFTTDEGISSLKVLDVKVKESSIKNFEFRKLLKIEKYEIDVVNK